MPLYNYKCSMCSTTEVFMVRIADRDSLQECPYCDQKVMVRQFEGTRNIKVFKPYHNTALGVDVETKSEQDYIYRDMGVIEAGDKVRGARNFDEKANNILPERLNGSKYVPQEVQKQRRAKQKAALRKAAGVQVETKGEWKDAS